MALQKNLRRLAVGAHLPKKNTSAFTGLILITAIFFLPTLTAKHRLMPKRPLLLPATMTVTLLCGARS